jgi:hypothetical protein
LPKGKAGGGAWFNLANHGVFAHLVKMRGDGWESSFPQEHQYTLEGNRLVLEDGSVYIKQ